MKRTNYYNLLAALALSSFLVACGGNTSSSSASSEDSTKAASDEITLEKKWETDTSVRAPESALWDAGEQILYVSDINGDGNAKDGNGFISKLGTDGKVQQLHWVDGLDAPKGLGMYEDELYAADLDQLVVIDKVKGAVKKKVPVPGATFLNDIAVDDQGNVFISDTRQGKVYRYKDGKVDVYLDGEEVKGANGLLIWHQKLWILSASGIYQYDEVAKKLSLFSDAVKGGDGLVAVNDSELIASRWKGEVFYIKADGSAVKLLDTQADHKNTADICYLPGLKLLVIPTFTGNTVMAYELKP